MVDITMCSNAGCNSCKKCYRFMAPEGKYQSFANFAPPEGKDKCSQYWPIDKKERNAS